MSFNFKKTKLQRKSPSENALLQNTASAPRKYFHTDRPDGGFLISVDVLIAIFPLLVWAVYLYGLRPVVITAISMAATSGLDLAVRLLTKRGRRFDLSSAVTGALIALCLPPSAPLWLPLLTSAVAVTVKHIFGAIRRVIVNPVIVPIIICLIAFPKTMGAIPEAGQWLDPFAFSVSDFAPAGEDAISTVLSGFLPNISAGEMFFGIRSGTIGEVSAFLILAGGIYLCTRGIFKPLMPTMYIVAIGVIAYLQPTLTAASDMVALKGAAYHILGANTFLCAIYLTQDHETVPNSFFGTLLAGVIGGSVTVALRYYVSAELSALLGILALNLLSPALDSLFRRAPFGGYLKPELFEKLTAPKEDKR